MINKNTLSEQQPSVVGITISILKMKVLRIKAEWITQLCLVILLQKQWTGAACFFDIFLKKKKKKIHLKKQNPPSINSPAWRAQSVSVSIQITKNWPQSVSRRCTTCWWMTKAAPWPCEAKDTYVIKAYEKATVAKSCLTLCDLVDCSMPGSSVLHYRPEFAQIRVHWVGDAI